LVIVTELADRSLRDLARAYQEAGEPGIPRDELLGYLDETAEVLDVMNLQHQLLHLDIKPDNIFLIAGHAKVGDFGLVTGLVNGNGEGESLSSGLSPSYAAPEVFLGQISPQSDQYSLAVLYAEMRTGRLPFTGKSAQQLMLLHHTREPALDRLAAAE